MNKSICWLAACAAALVVAGCGGTTESPILGNASNPRIRVVNGTTSPANVFIDDNLIAANLTQGTPTAYTVEDNTNHTISWKDSTTNGTRASTSELFQLNNYYTVIDASSGGVYKTIILTDNRTTNANSAKFRVANVASDAGPVDVYITPPGANISGAVPTLANLTYPSNTDYQALVPGTYEVRFTQAGTKTVVFDQQVNLTAAQIETDVLLSGTSGATAVLLNDLAK